MRTYLCVAICIFKIVNFHGQVFGDKVSSKKISELKEMFEKEIRRMENKHDDEIQSLRREINQERHERMREIAVLKGSHESALKEIIELKHQLAENGHFQVETYFEKARFEDWKARYGRPGGSKDVSEDLLTEEENLMNPLSGKQEHKNNAFRTDKAANTRARNLASIKREGRINGKRQVNVAGGSGIAFFAKLNKTFIQANQNQTIVFDKVVTNKGNDYHSSHGIFTATTPGLYVFSATLMTESPYAHAKLVKNGEDLVRLHLGGHWEQSSHMVVVELKAGDLISIESHDQGVDYSGYDYSSFSGFLLYDYSDVNPIVGK